MRALLALLLLGSPAYGWEFTPGLPCRLAHDGPQMSVELTHDPTQPLFTISLTRAQPWPDDAIFSLTFDGAAPLTITTSRHVYDQGGRRLTVTDTGFGNVLRGLAQNRTATALIGGEATPIGLAGATGPVADFANCRVDPSV